MSAQAVFDIIGYVGSALIIVSLTRKSILKLRLFGLAGSTVFFVYSILIEAYPIAVVNVIIMGIHIYFLWRLTTRKAEVFSTLQVDRSSSYLGRFLDFYRDDIARFQPEFRFAPEEQTFVAFILRDLVPAGIFIASPDTEACHVHLDYAVPEYRDFKMGRYVYSPASGIFDDMECRMAWSEKGDPAHENYLRRVGFTDSAHGDRLEIELPR